MKLHLEPQEFSQFVRLTADFFSINPAFVEQTLLEKLVSLIRFSYNEDPVQGILPKIRHFYDLYFLTQNADCQKFLDSGSFQNRLNTLLEHDRNLFREPNGWQDKSLSQSPLIADFSKIWVKLKSRYHSELSALAFRSIPAEKDIASTFELLVEKIVNRNI